MKNKVILFGILSGLVVTLTMAIGITMCYNSNDFEGNMVLGYTAMFVAFTFIFVGVKQLRDKQYGGHITFGKAFMAGFYMSLISSTMYVLTWLVMYYTFIPDFMEKYTAHMIQAAQESGASAAEMQKTTSDMADYVTMYKNPVWVILLTYMEIFPLALVFVLLSALILKKKPRPELQA